MTSLAFAVLLPSLFWDRGPETAAQLRQAGVTRLSVPASLEGAWKTESGFSVRVADPQTAIKLVTPGVQYRTNEASATRSPWINTNGWRFLRQPKGLYIYEAPGKAAALAAIEAFMYQVDAMVQTDAAGLEHFGRMLADLGQLDGQAMPLVADIGFMDDGSREAGEVMNLLTRRNLLFRIVEGPDSRLPLNVHFGSDKYPKADASNPSEVARKIRYELTDEKRALRIYGSEVVIARLTGEGQTRRLQLLNYAAASRPLNGIRVRVLRRYTKHQLKAFESPKAVLVDYEAAPGYTEFTLPELKSYAVVDLAP